MLLNSCHSVYYGYGVSPVDATLGIISGRPYGGVGSVEQGMPVLKTVHNGHVLATSAHKIDSV